MQSEGSSGDDLNRKMTFHERRRLLGYDKPLAIELPQVPDASVIMTSGSTEQATLVDERPIGGNGRKAVGSGSVKAHAVHVSNFNPSEADERPLGVSRKTMQLPNSSLNVADERPLGVVRKTAQVSSVNAQYEASSELGSNGLTVVGTRAKESSPRARFQTDDTNTNRDINIIAVDTSPPTSGIIHEEEDEEWPVHHMAENNNFSSATIKSASSNFLAASLVLLPSSSHLAQISDDELLDEQHAQQSDRLYGPHETSEQTYPPVIPRQNSWTANVGVVSLQQVSDRVNSDTHLRQRVEYDEFAAALEQVVILQWNAQLCLVNLVVLSQI